jgi:hypothetical protein
MIKPSACPNNRDRFICVLRFDPQQLFLLRAGRFMSLGLQPVGYAWLQLQLDLSEGLRANWARGHEAVLAPWVHLPTDP